MRPIRIKNDEGDIFMSIHAPRDGCIPYVRWHGLDGSEEMQPLQPAKCLEIARAFSRACREANPSHGIEDTPFG